MPSANNVILIGHLTRDPEARQLPSQSLVAEFGLAINRHYTTGDGEKREEVCFVDCAVYGRQAETIQKYCAKGDPLYVQGRLKLDQWEDKTTGGKRSKISVVVENFQFLKGREQQGGEEREQDIAPQSRRGAGPGLGFRHPPREANPPVQQPFGDESNFKEADIPF